ncbi:MAG: hypothetical protein QOF51_1709 [Chloroflexota bacterium]|jgi:hypothetical protein|nr:hypothetical protein [Chloroflexota bacterium]
MEQPDPATVRFDPELLENVHDAFRRYEESGDAFERARIVSQVGKTYAPQLLALVERLLGDTALLLAALEPFAAMAGEESDDPASASTSPELSDTSAQGTGGRDVASYAAAARAFQQFRDAWR